MKRDMDLVRYILIKVEEADTPVNLEVFIGGPWGKDMISYHVRLLEAHGLIDADMLYADDCLYSCKIDGLTWEGADFLDAIRDDGIWKQTKDTIAKVASSVTMQTVRETAVLVATKAIKAALGV